MTRTEWLQSCCSRDRARQPIIAPFGATLHGARVDVATDGRIILAIDGAEYEGHANARRALGSILPTLSAPPAARAIDLPATLAKCAPLAPAVVICDACNNEGGPLCASCGGDGECECRCCDKVHDCGVCDGSGCAECPTCGKREAIGVPVVQVAFAGRVVDVRLLLCILAGAPDDAVRFTVGGPLDAVLFWGDGWRAALMPIKTDEEAPEVAVEVAALRGALGDP